MPDDAPLPVLALTPLNPAFRDDPYAMLESLRTHHPVMRDEAAGVFFLSRHEDVRRILTDLTLWRSPEMAEAAAVLTRRGLDEEPTDGPRNPTILLMDDPDHARIRNPLAQALYKRAARFRPQVEQHRRRHPGRAGAPGNVRPDVDLRGDGPDRRDRRRSWASTTAAWASSATGRKAWCRG